MTEKRKQQYIVSQRKSRNKQKIRGDKTISFTVSKELYERIHRLKGKTSYAEYIKNLILNKRSETVNSDSKFKLTSDSENKEYEIYEDIGDMFFDLLAFFQKNNPDLIQCQMQDLWREYRSYSSNVINIAGGFNRFLKEDEFE